MITKALALVLSMTMTILVDSTDIPTYIPVDIDFCDLASGEDESICYIQESEFESRNKIFLDQNGQNPRLMIDKRDFNQDKANYLFGDNTVKIGQQNIINLPYLQKSILIRPGTYKVEKTKQGYLIYLEDKK